MAITTTQIIERMRATHAGRPLKELTEFEQDAMAILGAYQAQETHLINQVAELRALRHIVDRLIDGLVRRD
jgi:hypothetical protein